jgi:nucleoid-associated protein YgaU
MSVATEFAPVVCIPPRARAHSERSASVLALHRPSARSVAAPLRLTRRGLILLALAVLVAGCALIGLARASAPASARPSEAPLTVLVRPGDTLWAIASRIAPERDPRAEVTVLQQLNGLTGAELAPGQVLRTR